jgi:lipopolysaccharide export system permease protein
MTDVVIYDLSDPLRRRTIYADSGLLALAPNHADLDLTLYDGVMQEVPNNRPAELSRLFYRSTRKRVKGVISSYQESSAGTVSKGDREMSVCEMQRELERADFQMQLVNNEIAVAAYENEGQRGKKPTPPSPRPKVGIGRIYCGLLSLFSVTPAHAQGVARYQGGTGNTNKSPQEEMAFRARLQDGRFRWEEARRERNRYDVEIQKKFSLAASCMIFVLVGAPIALRFPRGGVGLVIGVSFAIFGIYYVGLIGGETLADKGYLPPWLAMWGANIILLVLGLVLVSQMGREATTARGGDFGEMVAMARARIFGWLRMFGVPVERRRA